MPIRSKMMFVLLGDDQTGKTTLQKMLIDKLCDEDHYGRLYCNKYFQITHPEIKRKYRDISFANRSYQEKVEDYESIENYFANFFREANIAFVSTHLVQADAIEIIRQGKRKFYNVFGVFWTNSIATSAANPSIAELDWDERLVIDNPQQESATTIENQLYNIAENIVTFIANRTSVS